MKKNCYSGFTLLEAMVSVAIFGIMFYILSGVLVNFQKGWLRDYAKQNISAQFIKIYRAIDGELSTSRYNYVYSYNRTDCLAGAPAALSSYADRRWIFFPKSSLEVGEDGFPHWDLLIVYALKRPEGDKCVKNSTCPHKRLLRYEIRLGTNPRTTENNSVTLHKELLLYRDAIPTILDAEPARTYPLGAGRTLKFESIRMIESNIIDLELSDINHDNKAAFVLTLLRLKEAEKAGIHGSEELLQNPTDRVKKYLEKFQWTTMTENV